MEFTQKHNEMQLNTQNYYTKISQKYKIEGYTKNRETPRNRKVTRIQSIIFHHRIHTEKTQ